MNSAAGRISAGKECPQQGQASASPEAWQKVNENMCVLLRSQCADPSSIQVAEGPGPSVSLAQHFSSQWSEASLTRKE